MNYASVKWPKYKKPFKADNECLCAQQRHSESAIKNFLYFGYFTKFLVSLEHELFEGSEWKTNLSFLFILGSIWKNIVFVIFIFQGGIGLTVALNEKLTCVSTFGINANMKELN